MSNLARDLSKYKLEGLDCANCADKIDKEFKKEELTNSGINFATKTVVLDPERINKAQKIVDRIEPGVKIIPIETTKNKKVKYILDGLCCANCSEKISNKLIAQGYAEQPINFAAKSVYFNPIYIEEVQKIVDQIESGVVVKQDGAGYKQVKGSLMESIMENKKDLLSVLVAGTLMIIGILYGDLLHDTSKEYLEYGIFFIAYLLVGGKVVWKALRNLTRGEVFDENFLMSIATIGAFIIHQLPEAVGVMLFYSVGEFLQGIAVNRSRGSIKALMDIRPDYANLFVNGEIKKLSPEEVEINDIIVIRPGEKVPLDGNVIEGSSFLDTSALTGESVPRKVEPGEIVLAGSVNTSGLLKVIVQKTFGESSVAKILDLVENAGSRKAPTEQLITKFARYYTPAVVFTSLAIALIPPLVIDGAVFKDWIYRALTILVISCPCALVISVPLGYFGGIGGASKKGILIKGANFLEALTHVNTVALDKTGTITKGVFKVTQIKSINGFTKDEVLKYTALVEAHSSHPIAKSILKEFSQEIEKNSITDFEEVVGFGVKAKIEGKLIFAGNDRLLHREGIQHSSEDCKIPGTVVYLAIDRTYAGYIKISDEIKPDSQIAINALKQQGIKNVVMLTGDHESVAREVAAQVGVDKVFAELLPDGKVAKLEEIEKELGAKRKAKVAFVGDGINDAPVISRADIGIAMGGLGSDAAIEAADVVIMEDKLSKIATAIGIAWATRKIIIQNIVFAMAIKGVFISLGAVGVANMWEAVFADVGVTILAILNASRALKYKEEV